MWSAALVAVCLAVLLDTSRSRSSEMVSIEITGEIDVLCSLNSAPTVELGEIGGAGHKAIPFQIDCNTPFQYAIHSQNGALATNADLQPEAGLTTKIPYLLDVRISTNIGEIGSRCESGSLNSGSPSCGTGHSGEAVAIRQNGMLAISWRVSAPPLAGVYTDILTLSISPRL